MQTGRKKILVVDDNLDLVLATSLRLRDQGFTIVSATNGQEAIRVAHEEMPDLVLLDLGLPEGDGFEVLRQIRASRTVARMPVIVMSGWDERRYGVRSRGSGADLYLEKPVYGPDLLRAIRGTLGSIGSIKTG